jgi:hypothetical protein
LSHVPNPFCFGFLLEIWSPICATVNLYHGLLTSDLCFLLSGITSMNYQVSSVHILMAFTTNRLGSWVSVLPFLFYPEWSVYKILWVYMKT